jgi:hypothetical protein
VRCGFRIAQGAHTPSQLPRTGGVWSASEILPKKQLVGGSEGAPLPEEVDAALPAWPSSTLQETTFLAYRSRFTSHPRWAIEMVPRAARELTHPQRRKVSLLCLT